MTDMASADTPETVPSGMLRGAALIALVLMVVLGGLVFTMVIDGDKVTIPISEDSPIVVQSDDAAYLLRGTVIYPDCAAGGGDLVVQKSGSGAKARWLGPSTAKIGEMRPCNTGEHLHVDRTLAEMAQRAAD